MVNTPRQKAYAMGGKRHSHDHEGIGVQQSSVGALIGKSDAAMKKRLGISDADEARRTVETLAACGGVSALAAACGSSVGDFGSGLWTGDDVATRRVLEANGRPRRAGALEFLFRAARTGGAHAGQGPGGHVLAAALGAAAPAAPGPGRSAAVRDAKAARDGLEPRGAAAHVAAGAPHTSLKRNVVLFSAVPGASVKDAAPPDDAVGGRRCRGALAVDVEVTLDAMRLALTQGTVESGLAVLAALAPLRRACPGSLGDFAVASPAGRSRPPDASLRVLFDALSAAPPGAHLSDARVVAPAARDAPADKRPRAPRWRATPLAALGGPASVGALLANYAASKHPWSSRGRCPRQSRGPLPRVAADSGRR
ncbi:hypothetical protein JL721_9470 [Aureococcus anophagefferens]|nr:hypothetical protein JL721_9470 [Aureococcus anophagefferens]